MWSRRGRPSQNCLVRNMPYCCVLLYIIINMRARTNDNNKQTNAATPRLCRSKQTAQPNDNNKQTNAATPRLCRSSFSKVSMQIRRSRLPLYSLYLPVCVCRFVCVYRCMCVWCAGVQNCMCTVCWCTCACIVYVYTDVRLHSTCCARVHNRTALVHMHYYHMFVG